MKIGGGTPVPFLFTGLARCSLCLETSEWLASPSFSPLLSLHSS